MSKPSRLFQLQRIFLLLYMAGCLVVVIPLLTQPHEEEPPLEEETRRDPPLPTPTPIERENVPLPPDSDTEQSKEAPDQEQTRPLPTTPEPATTQPAGEDTDLRTAIRSEEDMESGEQEGMFSVGAGDSHDPDAVQVPPRRDVSVPKDSGAVTRVDGPLPPMEIYTSGFSTLSAEDLWKIAGQYRMAIAFPPQPNFLELDDRWWVFDGRETTPLRLTDGEILRRYGNQSLEITRLPPEILTTLRGHFPGAHWAQLRSKQGYLFFGDALRLPLSHLPSETVLSKISLLRFTFFLKETPQGPRLEIQNLMIEP